MDRAERCGCASCVIASCITASCIITSCIIECYFKHPYDCATCTSTCHFKHPYEACAGAALSLDGWNRQRRPGKRVEEVYQPSAYYPAHLAYTKEFRWLVNSSSQSTTFRPLRVLHTRRKHSWTMSVTCKRVCMCARHT